MIFRQLQVSIIFFLIYFFNSGMLLAQGTTFKNIAKELVETISKKFGSQATRELAELGGETAVQEILEKAAIEGGENLTKKIIYYGKEFGPNALKTISKAPKPMIEALEGLPSNLIRPAFQAAAREPEVVTNLITKYGGNALRVAAKHPGVGTKLVSEFGQQGIEVSEKLSTEQVIKLLRMKDELKTTGSIDKYIELIKKYGGEIVEHLDKHKKLYFIYVPGGYILTKGGLEFIENPDKYLQAAAKAGARGVREALTGPESAHNTANTNINSILIMIFISIPIIFIIYRKTKSKRNNKDQL